MACEFEIILNAGPRPGLAQATAAIDLIDLLEDQLSIYRSHSEMTRLNAAAAKAPQTVEPRLFALLCETIGYAVETGGAYDPTAGPLIALWRTCRREKRAPTDAELRAARSRLGFRDVDVDMSQRTVSFRREGIELNLNAIGKGYALDRAAEVLEGKTLQQKCGEDADAAAVVEQGSIAPAASEPPDSGPPDEPLRDWLMHAGHSSILAKGSLAGHSGWPIELAHPLFPGRRLGTLSLKDRGMSTSGSAVQFFRAGGRKYGHLLDPRTGWPADSLLCAIVLAKTAARAEALSTAFFVMGVEKSLEYCHNDTEVAALLVPAANRRGGRVAPVNCGIPEADLWLDV